MSVLWGNFERKQPTDAMQFRRFRPRLTESDIIRRGIEVERPREVTGVYLLRRLFIAAAVALGLWMLYQWSTTGRIFQ